EQIRQRSTRNRQARPNRQGEGDGRRREAPAHFPNDAPRRHIRDVVALRWRSTRPAPVRTQACSGTQATARRRDCARVGTCQAEEVTGGVAACLGFREPQIGRGWHINQTSKWEIEFASSILQCVEDHNFLLSESWVRQKELRDFFEPLASRLGINVQVTKKLRSVDRAKRAQALLEPTIKNSLPELLRLGICLGLL